MGDARSAASGARASAPSAIPSTSWPDLIRALIEKGLGASDRAPRRGDLPPEAGAVAPDHGRNACILIDLFDAGVRPPDKCCRSVAGVRSVSGAEA